MHLFIQDIQEEINSVECYIKHNIQSHQNLINTTTKELLEAGGKRLRPAFVITAGKFGKYNSKKLISMAAALEIIHMATLIHDDIIDDSRIRRGIPTIQHRWGKDTAVFTGDYLLSKAFDILVKEAPPGVLPIVSQVMIKICEGEVDQYEDRYNTDVTVRKYLKRIKRKTALLFSLSCEVGSIISGADLLTVKALKKYGLYVGMAFQITDDILDIQSTQRDLGKPVGNDLMEGIYTLPVIYAIKNSGNSKILGLLNKKEMEEESLQELLEAVRGSGGIEYSLNIAKRYLAKARKVIEPLPDNDYKAFLIHVINTLLTRKL